MKRCLALLLPVILAGVLLLPLNAAAQVGVGLPRGEQSELYGDLAGGQSQSRNNKSPEIIFFYSPTCPHCLKEQTFLDILQAEQPELKINRFLASDSAHHEALKVLLAKHDAARYFGIVPLTFVGEIFLPGFDSEITTGASIREALLGQPANGPPTESLIDQLLGGELALPLVAAGLGFLDGFNVCSLGALILILGLVMTLKSRRLVVLMGGTYLLVTAIIYGLLLVVWHQIFTWLAEYVIWLEYLVGLIALVAGVVFLRTYWRQRRTGPMCGQTQGQKIASWFRGFITKSLGHKGGVALALLGVLAFAAVITVIEFPCSAGVPVAFAGLLASRGLDTLTAFGYILIFLLFYLLDEILVFSVAAWKLKIWLTSPKFTQVALLIEGLALLFMAGLYLWPL